jgi:hypothetical protein
MRAFRAMEIKISNEAFDVNLYFYGRPQDSMVIKPDKPFVNIFDAHNLLFQKVDMKSQI